MSKFHFKLVESIASDSIDSANSIVKGAKLLGFTSQNGVDYSKEAIERDYLLYADKPVYIEHEDDKGRKYRSLFGCVLKEGLQVKSDGLYGDIKYNPKHQEAEAFVWNVQNLSQHFGLSHDGYGSGHIVEGRKKVTKLLKVKSVDIVARPATTFGLFEEVMEIPDDTNPLETPPTDTMDDDHLLAHCMEILKDDSVPVKERLKQIAEVMKMREKHLNGDTEYSDDDEAESFRSEDDDDKMLESLRKLKKPNSRDKQLIKLLESKQLDTWIVESKIDGKLITPEIRETFIGRSKPQVFKLCEAINKIATKETTVSIPSRLNPVTPTSATVESLSKELRSTNG